MFYTGIGSRNIDLNTETILTNIAKNLDKKGYILRTGGSNGSDMAFIKGSTNKEIYVPWNNFNNFKLLYPIKDECFLIAKKYHPAWNSLSNPIRKLMARNVMQVLGYNINNPSDFLICYTNDGCDSKLKRTAKTGGTGLAIALADDYNIPIYNIKNNIPSHFLL